ncbi:hypothetical protein COCNU_08G000390 [Cocos nucifera]|uniref:Uncharacterized protein n=1 Tax=Cocos nucifera TaxID=13894 RepID=A0A8K0IGG7_COCNU|nr:hypothetical protein COCNU_08G000390 [Cocos nucifera]
MPTLEPVVTALSPILSDEAAPSAPVQQKKVVERRKKKTIDKKGRRKRQAIKDAEAESEVLKEQRRELEAKFVYTNRMYIEGLYKKKELEEIFKLKEAFMMAGANSPKSEELGPP